MFYLVLLAVNILSIFVCHFIAKNHGVKPVFWGVMGAIFGPFAIPFVMMSKPETKLSSHH